VLGLTQDALVFHGLFGETETLATSRIQKIVTGSVLSSGRRLLHREVLRLTASGGEEIEFVLERASASAWRSHLGLWAVEERRAAIDVVTPGRR
jgi:S-adenosylmethionine/arginine decarboxylase-like enzyme